MSKSRYLSVRIKPFNPRKGYLARRYTYKGRRFDIDDGWHDVPRRLAEEMKAIRQRGGSKVFDVKDLADAQKIDDVEDLPSGPHRDADHAVRVKPSDFKRHKEMEEAKQGNDVNPMDNDPSFFRSEEENRELEEAMDPANDEDVDDKDDDEDEEEKPTPTPRAKRSSSRTSKRRSRKKADKKPTTDDGDEDEADGETAE